MADQGTKVEKVVAQTTLKMNTHFKNRVPLLSKFADIHLLVGYLSSVLLPIAGFVGSCILVRFRGDYTNCLIKNYYIKVNPSYSAATAGSAAEQSKLQIWVNSQKEDRMRFWLRVHETLTFLFSLSFFFFIQRGSDQLQALNAVIYMLLMFAFIVFGLWALISHGGSECKETAYGKMTLALALINLIVGFLQVIIHAGLYFQFKKNKALPTWLVGKHKPGEQAKKEGQIQPMGADGGETRNLLDQSIQQGIGVLECKTEQEWKDMKFRQPQQGVLVAILWIQSRQNPDQEKLLQDFTGLGSKVHPEVVVQFAFCVVDTSPETNFLEDISQYPICNLSMDGKPVFSVTDPGSIIQEVQDFISRKGWQDDQQKEEIY